MKKSIENVIYCLFLCLLVVVITISVFVHDCLASSPMVWLKRNMKRAIEALILMAFISIVNVILFVDEYVLVGPIVWMERTGRFVFCLLLLTMIALGGRCVYQALGPHAGFHSIVQLLAGMFFFIITLTGFHYRQKVWSLSL